MLRGLRPVTTPSTVALAALLFFVAVGCADQNSSPIVGTPGTQIDAGASVTVAPCNDLVIDGPTIFASCSTCVGCPTSGAPAIAEGTYDLSKLVLYLADCNLLTSTPLAGKMRVRGNVMDIAIKQPGSAIGDTVVDRMQYTYTLNGTFLSVHWSCPDANSTLPLQGVNYNSDGRSLHFAILPGTRGDTVFVRRP
jgi:hypothetical protein